MSSRYICIVHQDPRPHPTGTGRHPRLPQRPLQSYEACVDTDNPEFNPCLEHYAPLDSGEEEAGYRDKECVEDSLHLFPRGTVCDHNNYK